jgi:hypothetical protein
LCKTLRRHHRGIRQPGFGDSDSNERKQKGPDVAARAKRSLNPTILRYSDHGMCITATHRIRANILTEPQSAQQSQNIQTLLEAEKEAAKVVQQARECTCQC